MTTILIKWPDVETSVACGKVLGCTSEEDGVATTMAKLGVINLSVIGVHYDTDISDPENPVSIEIPGWWVLVRVPDGFDLEEALVRIPNELQPEIVWASNWIDEDGNPTPRPPRSEAPQHRWA